MEIVVSMIENYELRLEEIAVICYYLIDCLVFKYATHKIKIINEV